MFSSLNKKVKFIYIFLVLIIFSSGSVTALSIYKVKNSMDGPISSNYKSIDSINGMINTINNQDKAILMYLQGNKDEAINIFHVNDDEFYKWLYIEKGNITEDGEADTVEKVNIEYIEFSKLFSSLQDYSNGQNHDELVKLYEEKIFPQVSEVIENLKDLEQINEDAMSIEKNNFETKMTYIIYLIFLLCLVGAIICGIACFTLGTRFFKTINLLFHSLDDTILLLDKNYKIKFINDKGRKLFKIKDNNYKKKYILNLINLPEIYNLIQEYEISKENNKVIEVTYNNKRLFLNIAIYPNKGKNNKFKEILLIIKDITDLVESEEVRKKFIGTISHELKTPLTSIMMGIGLINNEGIGKLNEKQKDIVNAIGEDVQNLNELVSNLLKVYEIQSNKNNFKIKSDDINRLIKEAFVSFKSQAKEKDISLELSLNWKLPYVMIDSEKIKWVLNNLISNAIRYTETGVVKISGSYDKEKVFISVTDTGRGIPKEYLNKVFERFVRVEGFEIPEESTGLGLAIAKEIVEIHGGKIWCESKVGVGSKFIFTIPISKK